MMTRENVYRSFIEFTERAGGMYLRIASLFCEHTPLSECWQQLAMQEKQHAGFLRFCLLEGLFARDLPDADRVRALGKTLDRLEHDINPPVLSLEAAFDVAIRIEASGLSDMYDALTSAAHRSIYLSRRKIQLALPQRLQKLESAGRECGLEKNLRKLHRLIRSAGSKDAAKAYRKVS